MFWARIPFLNNSHAILRVAFVRLYNSPHWNDLHIENQPMCIYHLLIISSHTVAFMQLSTSSSFVHPENVNPFTVELVLGPLPITISQDIVEEITASVQVGDTATGKKVRRY